MPGDLVLVTGATGMIGFRILVELLNSGYRARVAVRDETGFQKIQSLKPVASFLSNLEKVIVPDITKPGVYDDAVKGVKYVIHVASPLAHPRYNDADYEAVLIQPSIKGTVGMLESAAKAPGVERIIITASVVSKVPSASLSSGKVINESTYDANPNGPYSTLMSVYGASKALAYRATQEFMDENQPHYDVINIRPVFVLGRDDTVTVGTDIAKGTNSFLMGPLLGYPRTVAISGSVIHVDDVARMHVLSLDPSIKGHQDFLAASHPEGIQWADAFDIIKKHYPKQCDAGIFKVDDTVPRPPANISRVDNTKAAETFKITFKSFEEQVTSVADHFVELIGQR
ncbi:hypothetical protein F5884DRAFT_778541 [Xylogone sp. PMI_703]|nr:hypothetical protein F5884DRAFT_778541 [Xylogone sp. PMI_703]